MKCPFCKLDANHRIVWDWKVIRSILLELVTLPLTLILTDLWFEYDPYRRKCRRCGQIFVDPRRERLNFDACPKCEYNLTGNVSGRCPECGWRMTRRYRAHRRRADRSAQRTSKK